MTYILQEKQSVQSFTTAQKIEQLEIMKSKLLDQRNEIQTKIDRLKAKMESSSQKPEQQVG